MSKNSNNVIFTRAQAITEAKARLRFCDLGLSPKEKELVRNYIYQLGTDVFDHCRRFPEPERAYLDELRRVAEDGEPKEKIAAMLLLESALWLVKIKYDQLKGVLGD